MIIIDDDGVMHKVLPIDTLDKIETEIKELNTALVAEAQLRNKIVKIIDKYRKE